MTETTILTPPETGFEQHALRGRFNAAFFRLMDPYMEWTLRPHKQRIFAGLPREVVEIGPGVGANLRYLPVGSIARRHRAEPAHARPTAGCRAPARSAARPAGAHGREHRPAR